MSFSRTPRAAPARARALGAGPCERDRLDRACAAGARAPTRPAPTPATTRRRPSPRPSATLEQCVTSAEPGRTLGDLRRVKWRRSPARSSSRCESKCSSACHMKSLSMRSPRRAWAFGEPPLPGVKSYSYLKEVTNLSAPAPYRAAVRFRWLNAKGKLIRAAELRTPRCLQTAEPRNGPQYRLEEPASARPRPRVAR